MSRKNMSVALSSHLNTLVQKPSIAWENAAFIPANGTLYVKEFTMPAGTMAVGIANDSSDDTVGIYQLSVYAPANGSKVPALDMVDKLTTHFARGTKIVKGDTTIEIGTNSISPAMIDGNWYVMHISINWRCIT